MKKSTDDWFADWFDTVYYHTLYKDRDDVEAKRFIINLIDFLPIEKGDFVLDLACGKGRHSFTLGEQGFQVLGVDLSANSISCANSSKCISDVVQFEVHDMRQVIPGKKFSAIFNLFTSFGYFDDLSDNQRVINSMHTMLEDDGFIVIDFMNAQKVVNSLVKEETKHVDGIAFQIKRRFDGTHIFKEIQFVDQGKEHAYMERVQAIGLNDFQRLLSTANLEIVRTFGDFDLNEFDPTDSDRLIIIAQRKSWN